MSCGVPNVAIVVNNRSDVSPFAEVHRQHRRLGRNRYGRSER